MLYFFVTCLDKWQTHLEGAGSGGAVIRSGSGLSVEFSLEMSRTSFTDGAFIRTPDTLVDLLKCRVRKI